MALVNFRASGRKLPFELAIAAFLGGKRKSWLGGMLGKVEPLTIVHFFSLG